MKRFVLWIVLGVLTVLPGCTSVHDATLVARNRWFAFNAWREADDSYKADGAPWRIRRHIGNGFRDGYFSVASGGEGEVPIFPPTCYWGTWFANPRGGDQVQAYFAGYQDGAVMAARDGVGNWIELPASRIPPEALAASGQAPIGEPLPPGNLQQGPMEQPYMEELPPQDVYWPGAYGRGQTMQTTYEAPAAQAHGPSLMAPR